MVAALASALAFREKSRRAESLGVSGRDTACSCPCTPCSPRSPRLPRLPRLPWLPWLRGREGLPCISGLLSPAASDCRRTALRSTKAS
eukprot:scaffold22688_cov55-Phaeocystis_antarctica.AAC.8